MRFSAGDRRIGAPRWRSVQTPYFRDEKRRWNVVRGMQGKEGNVWRGVKGVTVMEGNLRTGLVVCGYKKGN